MAAVIDVTSEPAWVALIEKTVARYGQLDILVNNAGISGSSVGEPDGLEGWHRIIAVNQISVFLGTKLAARLDPLPTFAWIFGWKSSICRTRLLDSMPI